MPCTEDTSTKVMSSRVGEPKFGQMVVNTKANGKMAQLMEKDDSGTLTVTLMKVIG